MMRPFIPKEYSDMPDYYSVVLTHLGGKEEKLDLVYHEIIDKICFYDNDGKIIRMEVNPTPFYAFTLVDSTIMTVPVANVTLHFDMAWNKLRELQIKKLTEIQEKEILSPDPAA